MVLTSEQKLSFKRSLKNIHRSEEVQTSLMEHGYYTPFHITALSKRQFVTEAMRNINIEKQQAEKMYARAQKISQKAMHLYMNLKTTVGSPYYRALRGKTVSNQIASAFVDIPGYQELFGSLDYVEGEEWNSLFGLAAYFVDIMRITDRYVTKPNNDTIPAGMKLEERRPDLWTIPLDQEHTEKMVPYLAIVNERLLELAKKELDTNNPYKAMASMNYPFSLPVNLPLEQIRIMMKQAGVSLDRIYACVSRDKDATQREKLQISKDSLDSLSIPLMEQELAEFYGTTKDNLTNLYHADVFTHAVNINMEQLVVLLRQNLLQKEEEVASRFFINQGSEEGTYLILKENEMVNCDIDALERMNRFIRVSSLFQLSYEQTDWMLQCLSKDCLLDEKFLHMAVSALNLYEHLNMNFDDFMGIFGQIKTYGANSRFEQIFNRGSKAYHPIGAWNSTYTDEVISWNVEEDTETAAWLAGSMSISMTHLKNLANDLFMEDIVALTIEHVSLLYAHVAISKALSMDIEEYRVIRHLLLEQQISIQQLETLYWVKSSLDRYGLTVYDLDFLVNGTVTPYVTYRITEESVSELLQYIWNQNFEMNSNQEQEELESQKYQLVIASLANYFVTEQEVIMGVEAFFEGKCTLDHWYDAFLAKPEEGKEQSPYSEYIQEVLLVINQWLNVKEAQIPLEIIKSIGENGPSYGFKNLNKITLENWLSVYDFYSFCKEFGDTQYKLTECIAFDEKGIQLLSDITSWPVEQIAQLLPSCEETVTEKLAMLKRYFSCMNLLDVNIDFMNKLDRIKDMRVSDYDSLEVLCKNIGNSIEIKENTGGSDAILLQDRDRLVSILCWKMDISEEDLYKYLLIDIKMDEKTQISYIREAVSAVQLYLQECKLGFETGVQYLDIDESWWSWVLDYNMWEANRKNYVYPENYLIPSVRHTKTDPFVEVESGLQQSNITDNYVEGLCVQYLEKVADSMEIAIIAACERSGRTYMFGRTKKQPYAYYYCYKEHTPVFTQWKEIEGCSISSDYITPVVVFGKLYLFWTELKCIAKSMMNGSISIEGKSYTLDIKYTYRNTQDKWVAPQDLLRDELVYYEEDGKNPVNDLSLFKGIYNMEEEVWNKISIIPIAGKNYAPFEEKSLNTEKIMVIYGAPLNNTSVIADENFQYSTIGSEGKTFSKNIKSIIHNANLLKKDKSNGFMTAGFVKVYNYNLQEECIVRKNEFIVFDEYASQRKAAYVSPIISTLTNSFGVALSSDMLRDMYSTGRIVLNNKKQMISSDAFIMDGINQETSTKIFNLLHQKDIIGSSSMYEPLTVQRDQLLSCDLKALLLDENNNILQDKPWLVKDIEAVLYQYIIGVQLLPAGIRSDAKVIPVTNCPQQFIIDNVDETFLFTVKENIQKKQCSDITEEITVSYPLVDACVLRTSGTISLDNSIKLVDKMEKMGLLDNRHIPIIKNCTLDHVKTVTEGFSVDAQVVYNLLHNSPIVDESIFASEDLGINMELSKKIYSVFEKEGMIQENRACISLLFETSPNLLFSDLIASGEVKYNQLDAIYDCILYAPIPVSVKYWTLEGVEADKEQYTIMRLSNGASSNLKSKVGGGVNLLLEIDSQNNPIVPVLPFERYQVTEEAPFDKPKAMDGTAVDFEGLYGEYFWELFYHIPMLTAEKLKNSFLNNLSKSWYEYVFNPMNKEKVIENTTFSDYAADYINVEQSQGIYTALMEKGVIDAKGRVVEGFSRDLSYLSTIIPQAYICIVLNILDNYVLVPNNAFYWNFYPFHNHEVEKMLDILSDSNPAITVYNSDPYDPHAIARLRIGAYEKYTMLQYIDNLILWGDQKFTQNSWEAITSASMFYTMASQLLGKRPEMIGVSKQKKTMDYATIAITNPVIPQFLIEIASMCDSSNDHIVMSQQAYYVEDSTYFNVPENEELKQHWDIIEDRLFKLRNSLDINGNPRTIPLYGTEINPLALAKASYSTQGMMTPTSYVANTTYPYRFGFLIEQAKGLANVLSAIGSQMLSVMEKKDSESYMAMVAANEKVLMDLTTEIKESQIEEQEFGRKNLETSLESAKHRLAYYEDLIAEDLSEGERKSLTASDTAFALSTVANVLKLSAGAAHALPQIGSPFAMTYGGEQVGSMLDCIASGTELGASIASFIAQRSQTMAGYERRKQEWNIQKDSIEYEIEGINQQIEAAASRIKSAKADLLIHDKSLEQKEEILKFLKNKFTSQELYQWLQGRMSNLMWQSYQLVMELALGAQAAFQYEKDCEKTFLTYEYWDNQKCGLLSGENLLLTLEQMQNEYFKQSQRKMEIEKNISLALNCPEAFFDLKSNGKCTFDLTEEMFDYDYPGMYARKIVSVSITIPAVLGPYQSIHAIVTQMQNKVLISADKEGLEYLLNPQEGKTPSSVRVDQRVNQKIALSKGIDDTGLINLNFGDERYLPFEGTGAVSKWQLEMPKNTNLFNYNGITDVIIHVKYTAKFDNAFKKTVEEILNQYPRRGSIYYNLKQNFPLEWNHFMNDKKQVQELNVTIPCSTSYIRNPILKGIWFKFDFDEELSGDVTYQVMNIKLPTVDAVSVEMTKDMGEMVTDLTFEQAAGQWTIQLDVEKIKQYDCLQFLLKDGDLDTTHFKNIEMLLVYEGDFL